MVCRRASQIGRQPMSPNSFALRNPNQTVARDDKAFAGHGNVAKAVVSLARCGAGILGFGAVIAISINEANSSGVKSFGAWTVISELLGWACGLSD